MSSPERLNIHGTGLVLGRFGVLLRGPSGAGKSLLALELLDLAPLPGYPAALVADDRLDLEMTPDGVLMHAPQAIAGMIELRGRGIVHRPFRPVFPVHLVVDLVDELERMPEAEAFSTDVLGLMLPRCPVPRRGIADSSHQRLLIFQGLVQLEGPEFTQRQFNT